MGTLVRDLRHGFRLLLKNPGFTSIAVLSLALGIGANSALFSTFNSLLWRPLQVEEPKQIVVLYSKMNGQDFTEGFSYPEYRDYRDQSTVFSGLAANSPVALAVGSEDGNNTRAFAEAVSGNYFDMLGVKPVLGRSFQGEEKGEVGAHPVVILSHLYWQRRFASDPSIVGKTIKLNRQAFTVIGVAPSGFNGTYAVYFAANMWIPMATLPQLTTQNAKLAEDRNLRGVRVIGRLKPGVDVATAQAELDTIANRLAQTYPENNKGRKVSVYPELGTRPEVEISRATNIVAMIFLGLTGLVLLVACANVANLLLARSVARRKEIAVRLALGAGRGQLVRQLLTESLLLSLSAGALGLGLAWVTTKLLQRIRVPSDIPLNLDIHVDPRVVLFTLGVSIIASLAFGLVPALHASRSNLVPALKGSGGSDTPGSRAFSLRNALVIAQVSISLVLLVAASLLVRSVYGAHTIDPGFRTDSRLLMSFDPTLIGYDEQRSNTFYRVLLERIKGAPGVEAASFATFVPMDFEMDSVDVSIEGRAAQPGKEKVQVMTSVVDSGYFDTLGTSIKVGRAFTERDDATSAKVAIVNETMAQKYWPGQNPIGRKLHFSGTDSAVREVVGVAADGKYRQLSESARDYMFLPSAQNFRAQRTLVIKAGDAAGAIAMVRHETQALDPAMPIFDAKTMEQHMERAYLGPRLSATLIGPTGMLALIIAAIGLYGVMAYSVSQRTRELGIRIAIGATPGNILSMVMKQGLAVAGIGLALGMVIAAASTRLLANLLFGVTPSDPVTFVGVPVVLFLIAALATYVPGRRAVKVDPLIALRSE